MAKIEGRADLADRLSIVSKGISFISTAMTMEDERGGIGGSAREGMILLLQRFAAETEEMVSELGDMKEQES